MESLQSLGVPLAAFKVLQLLPQPCIAASFLGEVLWSCSGAAPEKGQNSLITGILPGQPSWKSCPDTVCQLAEEACGDPMEVMNEPEHALQSMYSVVVVSDVAYKTDPAVTPLAHIMDSGSSSFYGASKEIDA